MDVTGNLTDSELIEYIGLKIKFETLRNMIYSPDMTDRAKLAFIEIYLQEV